MSWDPELAELQRRRALTEPMGGTEAVERQPATRRADPVHRPADTSHLPVVHLVDQPAFVIGPRAEKAGTIRHSVTTLAALKAQIAQRLEGVRSPFRTAEALLVEDIADPALMRPPPCEWVADAYAAPQSAPARPKHRVCGRRKG